MKISTFPAVKPFIKLTRGRIGAEEEGRGKVTLGEGAGGKQVQCEAERGGKVTVGTEARGRKLSLFGRRRMRVIWRRAGQTEEAELRVTLKRGLEIPRKTSLTLEYK